LNGIIVAMVTANKRVHPDFELKAKQDGRTQLIRHGEEETIVAETMVNKLSCCVLDSYVHGTFNSSVHSWQRITFQPKMQQHEVFQRSKQA
jgi:hypothetical protein